VEDTPDNRAAILADTVKHWNNFIRGLLSATKAWKRYRDLMLDVSHPGGKIHVEEFPLEAQKHFVKANPHGDFDLIVEDIVTQPRTEEHLKTLFIITEKEI